MLQTEKLINALSESPVFIRKLILKRLLKYEKVDKTLIPTPKNRIALNFASKYYYSVLSPSHCAYIAYRSGLQGASINDYASLSSAKEFVSACKVLNLPYTLGYHAECVPLFNEKQASCYTYGIPYNRIKSIEKDLAEIRSEKKDHIEALIKKINSRLKKYKINVSLLEVLASSTYFKGGAVTEKHVCNVLAKRIIELYKTGESIIDFLNTVLKIELNQTEKDCILSIDNKYLNEDVTRVIYANVGVFKAGETLREATEFFKINKTCGGITAYKLRIKSYNEEDLLNKIKVLKDKNFEAVAFDDTSLTSEDSEKVVTLLLDNDMLPIAVNRMGMPRQVLLAGNMNEKIYSSMLAVIGSSISSAFDVDDGIFGVNTLLKCPSLSKRIELFKNIVLN